MSHLVRISLLWTHLSWRHDVIVLVTRLHRHTQQITSVTDQPIITHSVSDLICYTQQQRPFYGPLSGTTRVSQYQNKHSPTHHPDQHPIFISFFHLPRSIHSILLVQITCLAIFLHNLFPCPLWSTSWSGALHLILHTFLHPISVFFS